MVNAIRTVLKNRARAALFAAIALTLTAAGLLWYRFWRPPPPLEIAIWYWHSPFKVSARDAEQLRAIGVRRLFVRAGTFHADGGRAVRLTQPQAWTSRADGIAIYPVFNFDASVLRAFPVLPVESLAAVVLREFQRVRSEAERAGLKVGGIQLDLDCPTSRLPKYADLLHRIRAGLPNRAISLSITALPTWYHSSSLDQVLAEIDFAAPQYYEASVGASRAEYSTISQLHYTASGLASAGWRGAPFYAGVPAYGHALVYSPEGKLVGVFHEMGLTQAVRSHSFRLESGFGADEKGRPAEKARYGGEDVYELRSLVGMEGTRDQAGGYRVVYEVPTPALIARQLAILRSQRPNNCLGMILFRYPEPGEASTVPLSAIAAVVQGQTAAPQLEVRLRWKRAAWAMVDAVETDGLAPTDLTVEVTNHGSSSTFIASDAVTVTLNLSRAAIEDISAADVDSVETLYRQQDAPAQAPAMRSSLARANVIRFRRLSLAAGETQTLAKLRLRAGAAASIGGAWSARCQGGYDVVSRTVPPVVMR